jgi:hypothetical protein
VIEAVIVVGDLLRPNGDGQPGGTDRPTLWLWNAIKRQIYLASSLPSEALTAAALAGWIDALRPRAEADAYWASVHDRLPAPDHIIDLLRRRFCVGYELPPWLIRLLDENTIPYIDLRLHPVRFLDDLLFAARGSIPETQAALLSMAVHESEVFATAGLREAMCRFISEARVPDRTLLVAGQRRFDSTQSVGGKFFDAYPMEAEIHAICARYDAVVLKPHPLDRRHSLLEVAAAAPTRVIGVIEDNVYRMLSLPQITAVLTVNSGLAHEAPYFGKPVHALAPRTIRPGWRDADADPGCHASLDDIVLTPDFWRIVLAPHVQVAAADGMRLPPKPNRLRIALDSFWNYQEIDTDRIPRAS